MELEHLQKDKSVSPGREELPEGLRRTMSVSLEHTNIVNPDPNTPLTGLCLICHDNIMRCILYIKNIFDDVDPNALERLRNIRRSLEEDYLRLDLWISDSSVSKEHDYLAFGPSIAKPIRAALSAIHDQLSLLRVVISGLKQQSELDLEERLFVIEAAGQSITSQIRILAEMQSLVHNVQADQLPKIGPRVYLQVQIDEAFEMFKKSGQSLESLDDDFVIEEGVRAYHEAGVEQCKYCEKSFHFGTLDLHQKLGHTKQSSDAVSELGGAAEETLPASNTGRDRQGPIASSSITDQPPPSMVPTDGEPSFHRVPLLTEFTDSYRTLAAAEPPSQYVLFTTQAPHPPLRWHLVRPRSLYQDQHLRARKPNRHPYRRHH